MLRMSDYFMCHHQHQDDLAKAGETEVDALALSEGMARVRADSSLSMTLAVANTNTIRNTNEIQIIRGSHCGNRPSLS